MAKTTTVFLVRAENRGAPESFAVGLYPSRKLAMKRIAELTNSEGDDVYFDNVWYDEIKVSANGADFMLCNR